MSISGILSSSYNQNQLSGASSNYGNNIVDKMTVFA